MCGASGFLLKAFVEGTELKVCKNCAKYGKVVGKVRAPSKKSIKVRQRTEEPEIVEVIVENYSSIVKNAREEKGLKQEELAKNISEKESRIQKVESGDFKPSIKLAKKIEKFLRVKLIEDYEETHSALPKTNPGKVTVGDLIKFRKRKND
jgi:putative transcription factor